MAKKYTSDCGGFKPIVIPKQKPKTTSKTTKGSTSSTKKK